MKKVLLPAAVLLSMGLRAQVGVNTDSPKATLEVKASKGATNTNEGIIAPQLSKVRVAAIGTPVEGTLVYVIDGEENKQEAITSYTGNDSKVADITEKGYYFFNGTKWVKTSAGNSVSKNIYNADGTLTGKRTVTQGDNDLAFLGEGKIGIGTNNPQKKLHISSNEETASLRVSSTREKGGGWLQLGGANSGLAIGYRNQEEKGYINYDEQFNTAKLHLMTFNKTGEVGVNNPNPQSKLDVIGNIRTQNTLNDDARLIIDAAQNQYAMVRYTKGNKVRWDVGTSNDAAADYYVNLFDDAGNFKANALTIKRETGNIGIGTNTPDQKLVVEAASYFPLVVNSTNAKGGGGIAIHPNDFNKRIELSVNNEGHFRLWSKGSDKLYINSDNGMVSIPNLAGNGDRMVVADSYGNLSARPIERANTGVINEHTMNPKLFNILWYRKYRRYTPGTCRDEVGGSGKVQPRIHFPLTEEDKFIANAIGNGPFNDGKFGGWKTEITVMFADGDKSNQDWHIEGNDIIVEFDSRLHCSDSYKTKGYEF